MKNRKTKIQNPKNEIQNPKKKIQNINRVTKIPNARFARAQALTNFDFRIRNQRLLSSAFPTQYICT